MTNPENLNDDPEKQRLLDRVRKCLALAANAGTEGEAAAAAARAQAIVAEHNLSMSDVFAEKKEFVIDKTLVTKSDAWMRRVAQGTAMLFFCSYFYFHKYEGRKGVKANRRDVHNFVGAPHNIAVAKMMFEYLTSTINRLAQEGSVAVPAKQRGSYKTSFCQACSIRINGRLWERLQQSRRQETRTETGTTLPALANLYDETKKKLVAFVSENVGGLRTKKSSVQINNEAGYRAGREAGGKISLDTQVGGNSDRKQIGRS